MKKGEIYEGVVERIDFPNKGRVHVAVSYTHLTLPTILRV